MLRVTKKQKPQTVVSRRLKENPTGKIVSDSDYNIYVNCLLISRDLTPTLYLYETIDGEYIPLNNQTEAYLVFVNQFLAKEKDDFVSYRMVDELTFNAVVFSSGVPMIECTKDTYLQQIQEAKDIVWALT
jgi:hypothetical protein